MKDIEKLTEETLHSLDDMQAVDANPFLFTRIQARMSAKQRSAIHARAVVMYRLSAVLLLFLLINLSSYFLLKKNNVQPAKKISGIERLEKDYNLEQTNYDY